MEAVLASFDPEASIRHYFENAHATEALDRMLYADSQVRLPDHSVMILDRMTMAHGLEARSPFMDYKLAEFAARLPTYLKIKGRSLRYIEYQLAKRYLPSAVLNRPKQGFSVALPYMLRHEYSVLFRVLLENSHLARAEILSQHVISGLIEEHETGRRDHGNRLWLLIHAEIWYRMFMEGDGKDMLLDLLQAGAQRGVRKVVCPVRRPDLVA